MARLLKRFAGAVGKKWTAVTDAIKLTRIESLKLERVRWEALSDALREHESTLLSGKVPTEWDFGSSVLEYTKHVTWPAGSQRIVEKIPDSFIDFWTVSVEPRRLAGFVENNRDSGMASRSQSGFLQTAEQCSHFTVEGTFNPFDHADVVRRLGERLKVNAGGVLGNRAHVLAGQRLLEALRKGALRPEVSRNISRSSLEAFLASEEHAASVYRQLKEIAGTRAGARKAAFARVSDATARRIESIKGKMRSLKG